MSNGLFAGLGLVLSTALVAVFFFFSSELSEEEVLARQVAHLESRLKDQELEKQLLIAEYRSYRNQVAEILPHLEGRSQLAQQRVKEARALASLTLKLDEPKLYLDLTKSAFFDAKKKFDEGKLQAAANALHKFVERYPDSPHRVEALSLLTECLFKTGEYKKTTEVVTGLLKTDPEHPLTGKGLLRLGQILEREGRRQDALEVYTLVSSNFANEKPLHEAAQKMANNLVEKK